MPGNKVTFVAMLFAGAAAGPNMRTAPAAAATATELPPVARVLNKASNTVKEISSQAAAMQSRILQRQAASRAALNAQRKQYQANLTEEIRRNNGTKAANVALFEKNNGLQAENREAEKNAKELRKSANVIRRALQDAGNKLDLAMAFVADSLNATDDHDSADLAVLSPSTPKPTLDDYLSQARAELGHEKTTHPGPVLLQLAQATSPKTVADVLADDQEDAADAAEKRMAAGNATPTDLVPLLQRSLKKIAKAERAGGASLKANYEAMHKLNDEHYSGLIQNRKAMEQQGGKLAKKKDALRQANAELENSRDSLFHRMQLLQNFAVQVDNAMADTLLAVGHNASN